MKAYIESDAFVNAIALSPFSEDTFDPHPAVREVEPGVFTKEWPLEEIDMYNMLI
jgi:hypothetical protein